MMIKLRLLFSPVVAFKAFAHCLWHILAAAGNQEEHLVNLFITLSNLLRFQTVLLVNTSLLVFAKMRNTSKHTTLHTSALQEI